ncbi:MULTISPECIES: SDR family oxidoreductase [unclassified Streptomyces]|uniref:SDR family oxidoreductase n=1 Tax=unclassified Streptomyces TaxID=2593676 RepID=UPI0033B11574
MGSTDRPVALLTGTNRGTGRSLARELHERGYRLFSLNRTPTGEDWLHEQRCDLADPEQIRDCVARVLAATDRLDVCVSNAVDRLLEPIADIRQVDWDRSLAVNLSANLHLTQAVLPALRSGNGLIVFMGSHAGTRYFEGGATYSATKAALAAFVETLLLEERNNGVRACLISPGAIANLEGDTDPHKMTTQAVAKGIASIIDDFPKDLLVGEIEIRPASLPKPPVTGIDRLLHV